jgi:hypothetical protein
VLKKTITYKDLDGNDVTEDFYFNLSTAEIAEMELSKAGGLAAYLKNIIDGAQQDEIIRTFKMIISATVGRRSEDGKRFIKSQEISDEFMQTEAYSVLFMELLTNAEAAAQFITAVVPKDISDKLATREITGITDAQLPSGDGVTTDLRPKVKKIEDYTMEELRAMPYEEFEKLVSLDVGNLSKDILVLAMQRRTAGK